MTESSGDILSAWAEALYWRLEYMDCNPEIGMGPFPDTVLDEMLARNHAHLTEMGKANVLSRVRRRRHK